MTRKIVIDTSKFREYYISQNHTLDECSKFFGVSKRVLVRVINENGWHKGLHKVELGDRLNPRKKKIGKDGLAKKIAQGWSMKKCAKYYGCSNVTIKNRVIEYGIELPKPKDHLEMVKTLFYKDYSREEIAQKTGLSLSTVRRALKANGLVYSDEQISKINSRVVKGLYATGKLKPMHWDNYPESARKKISEWNKEHSREIREKAVATMLKRYGAKNPMELPEVRQKIKNTSLKKYGVESPMKNVLVAEKVSKSLRKTLAKKYGYEDRIKLVENKYGELGRKLSPREMGELWGLSQSNAYGFMRKYGLENYVALGEHQLEKEIAQFLDDNGIKYEKHNRNIVRITNRHPLELDFYLPEYNVAIEANDAFTHNSTHNSFSGKPKDKRYHFMKSKLCEENGIRLIHVWDYEWRDSRQREVLKSIILGACNKASTIYARKCSIEVRPSVEMREFFDTNNMAGFRGGKFAICLVYEGEIVMAYMMGHAFFGKGKYEWEVIRGATKLNYRVVGGASRIWKYFIENYNPKSIVYYVDYNYFNGNSLKKLGAKLVKVQPSFKNYFVNQKKVRNRQPQKHKEIKELIAKGKVWEIWDAGTKVYVWASPSS